MNIKNTLDAVVNVNANLCVNCFACIHACPVKECNKADNYVEVNSNLCIACGLCIEACTHEARSYVDDFDKLLFSLSKGEKMVAIVSPAVTANFPNYLKFNGLLRSLGIDAIFDMAIGAELMALSLAEYIQTQNPKLVISQQCPAIVNYIQLYQPELLKYLAPVDSALIHTAKMIKRFYPEYETHQIVYISTCNAAKREFSELKLGDYNVSLDSISQYIVNQGITIENLPVENYINPAVESGTIITISGGYTQLLERLIPNISEQSQKISGGTSVYSYINQLPHLIASGKNPLFVDGLSCSGGCNAKALLCSNQASAEEKAFDIRKRKQTESQAFAEKNKAQNLSLSEALYQNFSKYLENELYLRHYVNRWQNFNITYPNAVELRDVYKKMHKYTDKDQYNCTSCGYFSCERMAIAVFNGLNKPENCKFFIEKESEKSHNQVIEAKSRLQNILDTSLDGFIQVDNIGLIRDANPALKELLKKSDIIGKTLHGFFDAHNKKKLERELKTLFLNQQHVFEIELTNSEGQNISCRISASQLFTAHKEPNGFFAIISDISNLKQAEEDLKHVNEQLEQKVQLRTAELSKMLDELNETQTVIEERNQELNSTLQSLNDAQTLVKENEAKLSAIIACLPDAVMVIDRKGVVLMWNEVMEKLTGVKAEDMIGKGNYEYAIPFYGDRRKILIDLVFESVEVLQTKYSTVERKGDVLVAQAYSETLRKGDDVYMHGTARALRNDEGEIIGAIEIVRDITQSVVAEEKIKQQMFEIKEQQEEMLSQNEELRQTTEELAAQRDYLEDTMKEVRTAERKITSIIECMPDAVMVIDRKGVVQTWNQGMEELTGIKAEQIIGKGNNEYALPFYGDRRKVLIDLVFEPVETFKERYTTVERDGDILIAQTYSPTLRNGRGVYMHGTARALKNEEGEIVGAIEIVRDVTETVIAEQKIQNQLLEIKEQQDQILTQNEELQQTTEEIAAQRDNLEETMKDVRNAERKIAAIVECMPDAVLVIDKKGVVQTWNKEMELLTGTKAEEVLGKSNYEYALPFYGNRRKILIDLIFESQEVIEKNYSSVERIGEVLFAKAYLQDKDIYMHCTATELKDENGRVVGAIEIIKNVTESVLAEKRIKEQMSEIQQQHEELLSQNEEIRVINETLEDQKSELEKLLLKLQTTQSQLVQSEKMAALGKLIAGVAHEVNTPLGAIKSSSEEIAMAYRELMKELPQSLKQLTDIDLQVFQNLLDKALNTTITLSTREERALKRNLTEILKPVGFEDPQYIAGRLIQIGITELTETEIEFLKRYPNMVSSVLYNAAIQFKNNENVKLAVDKASRVIMALKMYSHSSSDNAQSAIDITKSIETVLTIYHNQIKKGIILHKNYQEVPTIMGYPDKLNQVWTNLIQNAIQAMNYAGTMTINIALENEKIVVSIQDSGCGIPEEIHARIFDPFFTTKKAGEGSGLGLDIVKKIVEEHNGVLSFESQVGQGTSFFVHLPVQTS